MAEKKIEIKGVNPAELFGVKDTKFKYIKSFYQHVKISARGNVISVDGDPEKMGSFEDKIGLIVQYLKNSTPLRKTTSIT